MVNEIGLNNDILSLLKNTFQKYAGIEQVKLYGSRAKGTFNERSKIIEGTEPCMPLNLKLMLKTE